MKLNYSTLAFTIVAVFLGTGRSFAQEGFAPMGSPYPAGAPAPYGPGMMQPGYGPAMGHAMPGPPAGYHQMAQAPHYGYPAPGSGHPAEGGAQLIPADMTTYEPAGDYVEYGGYVEEGFYGTGATALPPRAYGSFDLLYVWRKGGNFPATLTTSNPADAGILGQPSTEVLFGGNEQDDPHVGGRLTLGLWLDDYQDWSVGARFTGLEKQSLGETYTSDDYDVLAFPIFNTNSGLNDSILVALPGAGTGAADNTTVSLVNENEVYVGDVFLTKHLFTHHANRVDFVTGYSFARIEDTFESQARFTVQDAGGTLSVGDVVNFRDFFGARNEFHGGQFGLMGEFQDGPFTWRALGKVSIGGMRQEAYVSGATSVNGTTIDDTGVFARGDNSGSHQRSVFAYIPEVNLDLIYAYNCNLDFKVGTTFIYFSDVVTGGSLINPDFDPGIGGAGPEFTFNEQEYWILGMNFGIEYHY